MGDSAEVFRAMTERRNRRKKERLQKANDMLADFNAYCACKGLSVYICTDYHWQVKRKNDTVWINIYPSTGKYIPAGKKTRYGDLAEIANYIAGEMA